MEALLYLAFPFALLFFAQYGYELSKDWENKSIERKSIATLLVVVFGAAIYTTFIIFS